MATTIVLTTLFLLLPQLEESFSYFGVPVVPLVTLLLAFFCPIRWYAATTAIAVVQCSIYGGYAIRGGTFVGSDILYCVLFFACNAVVVGLLAEFRFRMHARSRDLGGHETDSHDFPD